MLAVQNSMFLTCINHPLRLKTRDCVPLLHPSSDEVMAMWVESIVLAIILFSYASGHKKVFSVVHIQQSILCSTYTTNYLNSINYFMIKQNTSCGKHNSHTHTEGQWQK